MRGFLLVLLLLPAFAMAATAAAPPLPEAGAVYVERDPAAIAMHPRPGNNASFRRQLNATIQKNPRNSAALIHRAFLFHASGDIEEGDRDFERVITLTDADPVNRRRAYWSLGWSAYNRGQPQQAIDYWRQAAELHGSRPSWYPYTVAVGLWTLGEKDAALAWYDAAARSHPNWTRQEGVQARTEHWREPERQAIEALFQAWSGHAVSPAP